MLRGLSLSQKVQVMNVSPELVYRGPVNLVALLFAEDDATEQDVLDCVQRSVLRSRVSRQFYPSEKYNRMLYGIVAQLRAFGTGQ